MTDESLALIVSSSSSVSRFSSDDEDEVLALHVGVVVFSSSIGALAMLLGAVLNDVLIAFCFFGRL